MSEMRCPLGHRLVAGSPSGLSVHASRDDHAECERAAEPACACQWTDPSTWLSAASCGYGSGYEPGSQMEWNPDCPVHRPMQSRFACTCGRFIPESAIRYEDFRDDSTFYGIHTEVEWDCSRCGTVKGEGSWEPPLVTFPTRVTPPESGRP